MLQHQGLQALSCHVLKHIKNKGYTDKSKGKSLISLRRLPSIKAFSISIESFCFRLLTALTNSYNANDTCNQCHLYLMPKKLNDSEVALPLLLLYVVNAFAISNKIQRFCTTILCSITSHRPFCRY